MSLQFQIDIAFDISDNTSDIIIEGLNSLLRNQPLTAEQKKSIPNIFQSISANETKNAFHGQSIFYLRKHYRHTQNEIDVSKWTIHLRQVFNDDTFYEEGYPLIAWLATISETEGFVGYVKEELAQAPKLVYIKNQEVNMRDGVKDDIQFKLADFDSTMIKWRD